jgi:TonB family protein
MLFHRLLESKPRTELITTAEWYVVSIVTHTVLIVGTVVATARLPKRSELADSFTPVSFLLPKDRTPGMHPQQERITFSALPAPGGEGQMEKPTDQQLQLKVMHEAGKSDAELAGAAVPEPQSPAVLGDSVMTVLEVDSAAARYEDSAAPPYPPAMLEKRIEGTVAVQYVVDTTGFADTTSFLVLSATHPQFAAAVRQSLPNMRFHPAIMSTHKVRQLVQQLFSFKIDTTLLAQQEKAPKKPRTS